MGLGRACRSRCQGTVSCGFRNVPDAESGLCQVANAPSPLGNWSPLGAPASDQAGAGGCGVSSC